MPVDLCNRTIEPGALVIYPRRQGSFSWMTLAEVVRVPEDGQCIKVRRLKTSDPWREVIGQKVETLRALANVVVVQEPPEGYTPPAPPPVKPPRVPRPPVVRKRKLATMYRHGRTSQLTPPETKILGRHLHHEHPGG